MATFRKRGDRWQAMVRKQGITRTRTFGNKAIAQKWARRVETEIEDGSHGEAIRGGTVAELVAELEALPMAAKWSRSKRSQVAGAVAAFGGRPAGALTRSEIDHWFHRSNYAASSKALTLKALQGVLREGSPVILRWATARQAVREAQAGLLAAGHASTSEPAPAAGERGGDRRCDEALGRGGAGPSVGPASARGHADPVG